MQWRFEAVRTRVKICGITRREDALEAARLGADAIGLVFWSKSRRSVTPEQALAVIDGLPPFVSVVGLFVDPEAAWVRDVLGRVPLDLLQFHGEEPAEFCTGFGHRFYKAVRMREGTDLVERAVTYTDAAGLLLDTFVEGMPGGTGVSFDWARVRRDLDKPVILAGGLAPDNVGEAIGRVRPWAVDVSGGVEAEPGVKDAAKMAAFIRGVSNVQ